MLWTSYKEMSVKSFKIINKTMDKEDLNSTESILIIQELNSLIDTLDHRKLKISNWYGRFNLLGNMEKFEKINRGDEYCAIEKSKIDNRFPWFLYWEIAWVIQQAKLKKDIKVLDIGGSSSLFSYYLASKGLDVTTIDLQPELVNNANIVGEKMGWKLHNYAMDVNCLELNEMFDCITSICVFEHLLPENRITIMKKINRLLNKGGKVCLTFDYGNPTINAQINTPDDVFSQFVKSSGLEVIGNRTFYDNNKRYLLYPFCRGYFPKEVVESMGDKMVDRISDAKYTFGALFLEKK